MRKFNGYDSTQSYSNQEKLPAGGYVLKIADVRYEEGQNGNSDRVVFRFDIDEGEYKGFFQKQYDSQTTEDKKWKGTFVLYYPKDDGTEQDRWTKARFKTVMENFEESNKGYKFDWDSDKLKGKLIGGIFVDTYSVIDGKEVKYVSLASKNIRTIDFIRRGNYKMPDPIKKNGANGLAPVSATSNGFMDIPAGSDEEIPF